jgi:hypothetical protein
VGVEYRQNFRNEDLLRAVNAKRLEPALKRFALKAIAEIKARTQSGKGIEGVNFPALSPEYARRKAETGRNPLPDRTWSGLLLKSIQSKVLVEPEQVTLTIFFGGGSYRKRKTTVPDVARYMQQLSPFFGLSRQQREYLSKTIEKSIKGKQ